MYILINIQFYTRVKYMIHSFSFSYKSFAAGNFCDNYYFAYNRDK